jgi:hypothetical protein
MSIFANDADRKVLLSTLWLFFVVNIIYADVFSLIDVTFSGTDVSAAENAELISAIVTPGMLFLIAIIMESGMAMIVLSRLLKRAINRWANIVIAVLQALVLSASLFVGTPKIYYVFFATVELITLFLIIGYAWTWKEPQTE